MPEHNIAGGEIWLHPDEHIVVTFDTSSEALLGLVTTRASGLYYASLLKRGAGRGLKFDLPQWQFTSLERSICESVEEARALVLNGLLSLGQHSGA